MLYLGMKESEKIYEEIVNFYNEFEINYEKYIEYNNKSAARRSRVALINLRKLIPAFRQATVAEEKQIKKNAI